MAAGDVICVNTETRINNAGNERAIELTSPVGSLYLNNSGELIASAWGIYALTTAAGGTITINNSGGITVSSGSTHVGIDAWSRGANSPLVITNTGNLGVSTTDGPSYGIRARSGILGGNSPITINNTGDIVTTSTNTNIVPYARSIGIYARSYGTNGPITITNSGTITSTANATGSANGYAYGIRAIASAANSSISITNVGDISVTSSNGVATGIVGYSNAVNSSIDVHNTGNITATAGASSRAFGINVLTLQANSSITVINTGDINRGAIVASSPYSGGINARALNNNSVVSITNSGAITAQGTGGVGLYADAVAINALTYGTNSPVIVNNSGDLVATGPRVRGIRGYSYGPSSPISITNSGAIDVEGTGSSGNAYGINAYAGGQNSPITINNSGSVYAKGGPRNVGIYSYSYYANKTTITNTGEIGAQSHLAIDVKGAGNIDIFNAGHITGFVDLTSQDDRFFNQSGGVFETKMTSLFGGGNDLFVNQSGATVLAATMAGRSESSGFQGLETFRNAGGLISMIDGGVGDQFTIANTPGSKNLSFQGGGFLGVDANLRGPGARADIFNVDGNVSGQTKVIVNNASTQPGVFNSQGIRVVNVMGTTPKASNFVLADGPIDTGFFDYDLYFTPTGSGHWDLRSFPGASAQALPKLLTASQDIWHQTSATWFDRTADLRVVLNGGGSPAYDAGTKGMAEPGGNGLTPGVWIKGAGSRLDRDGSATTKAYGRNYTYDLDNELDTIDLQVGVDMGQYDVLSQGDVLIFGVLGGFVGAGLDYDSLADTFNFSGGQVGAYATYLKDGLFVDTLLNVHLYEIDTPNFGMPDSLNATTVGLRTDAGYRFGSFTGGMFFEPLTTIEVTWADLDGFNVGGNKVSFSDDANVRGRIGGRVGTTTQAWEGTMMEPFLIASLWGNLSDENSATLVSSGRTFQFNDDLQDVWGELSAGVNLFNFSQTTAVFAKVDYTFGEDVQGVGGKAGMRVAW